MRQKAQKAPQAILRASPLLSVFHKILENPAIFGLSQKLGAGTLSQYHEMIRRNIKSSETSRILDIGCGIGAFSAAFGGTYFGVDINSAYIEAAKLNYRGNFSVSDRSKLNFSDAYFDHVTSIAVFHHLKDSQVLTTIAEGLRVCKPDGRFHVIEAIYPVRRRDLIKWAIFRADRGRHQRTYGELRELVAKQYSIEKSYTSSGFPHDTCYISIKK